MRILENPIHRDELSQIAQNGFEDFIKAVADVESGLLAIDAELHSDLESLLLERGSQQRDLWGINLYPGLAGEDFIEFDSLINIRPRQGNRTRGVESSEVQAKILEVVGRWILP
jgi:hypothetical protein